MTQLYTSCEELPLYNYIRCDVYGNLKHLIISGNPTAEELQTAWEKIQEEYFSLSESTFDAYAMTLFFDIARMEMQLEVIANCVDLMAYGTKYHCPELLDILAGYGYTVERDPNSPTFVDTIKRIEKRAKSRLIQLKDKRARFEQLKEGKEGNKITVAYYDNVLTTLSKHYGDTIYADRITVSRYASMLTQYMEYADSLKNQKDKADAGVR